MPATHGFTDSYLSLLWPDEASEKEQRTAPSSDAWAGDLNLADLVRALDYDGRHAAQVRMVLTMLSSNPAVIQHRQAVLDDLLRLPLLVERFSQTLAQMDRPFGVYSRRRPEDQIPLLALAARVGELEVYVSNVQSLHEGLVQAGDSLRSTALIALRTTLAQHIARPDFQSLVKQLPKLRVPLERLASISVGINLDSDLRPVAATLLSVNANKFSGPDSFLGRLLGTMTDGSEEHGIAPLHIASSDPAVLPMIPLFRDLARLLSDVAKPLAVQLAQYEHMNAALLKRLAGEIAFFLGGVRLMGQLRTAGLPLCRPDVLPTDARTLRLKDLYSPTLVLRMTSQRLLSSVADQVVLNDAMFDDQARLYVLTGPNSGGKTTFLQAVGLSQALFQAGLHVPAREAALSPVDAIFTHFPVLERNDLDMGRLGEEALRLSTIFAQATRHSLVLLNESLSSTSPSEAVYLGMDILRGLRFLGARGIYATHLHELGARIIEVERTSEGDSRLGNLVAGITDGSKGQPRASYRILPGSPPGRSYATELARQYGIAYDQIVEQVQERNLIQ